MEEKNLNDVRSMKNKKIYFLNIVIILAIMIGVLIYMITVDGIDNMLQVLQTVDYKWMTVGLICLILMWVAEAISVHIPLKKLYSKQTFANTFKVTMIGQLFNNLTPFASGGQAMQAYVFHKNGIRASDSFSILAMRFIITQTTLIIFTILVVLSEIGFFLNIFKDLVWIGIIGIFLNILLVVLIFMMGNHPSFIVKLAKPILNFFSKIKFGNFRLIKDKETSLEKFKESTANFNNQFKKMKEDKIILFKMIFYGLIQSILYYLITYCVYKGFGNSGINFLQIVTTQALLMLIMTIFPTPGAGIGAEGGFLLLFSSIFKNGTINMSILFWRIFVFYLPIIVGALFFLPTKKEEKNENK